MLSCCWLHACMHVFNATMILHSFQRETDSACGVIRGCHQGVPAACPRACVLFFAFCHVNHSIDDIL